MPVMNTRTLLASLSVLLGLAVGVKGYEQAVCPAGWEWNQNSLGQDPCTVVSLLDSHCRGDIPYAYQKLNASEWYVPPSKTHSGDLTCDCDTVTYSLAMACATCQGGISYGWDKYEKDCGPVLISQYSGDIPQGTRIPHWAFYNVTTLNSQQFDNVVAQTIGRDPEALPTTPTSSTGSSPTAKSSSGSKSGAIVGGVVGGIVGVIIIFVCLFFFLRRWSKNRERNPEGQWDNPGGYPGAYDPKWKSPPTSPHSATYSLPTGPSLTSSQHFQPYAQPPPQPNRAVTYVTPLGASGL